MATKPTKRIAKKRAKLVAPTSKVIYKVYFSGPNASFGGLQQVTEEEFNRGGRYEMEDEEGEASSSEYPTDITYDVQRTGPSTEEPEEVPVPVAPVVVVPPRPIPAPAPPPTPAVIREVNLKFTDASGTTYDIGDDKSIAAMPLSALTAMLHRDSGGKIMIKLRNGILLTIPKTDVEKRFKVAGKHYCRRTRVTIPTRAKRYDAEGNLTDVFLVV